MQVLSNRVVTRLRALIVLPTRDLVTQVRETFEAVGKGRGLKVAFLLVYQWAYFTDRTFRLVLQRGSTHLPTNKHS
jgi:superfamily II DNA/RNA helicase